MSIIVCKLPRAGLGNQLFPLMKAVVLHQLSGLPLFVTQYHKISLGPYLRGEKSKRSYSGYFKFQKNIFLATADRLRLLLYKNHTVVPEPSIHKSISNPHGRTCYLYSAMPHWDDYFGELKDYRKTVIDCFYSMLTPQIVNAVNNTPSPCIGIHIRMGDFKKQQNGNDIEKMGNVRTPESYFINIIQQTRQIAGKLLLVTIFTDGYREEFTELFTLPAVEMAAKNADITDMILLSKSKMIVASATSTFSYWAGFLADAPLIMHPAHLHASIRPPALLQSYYEGPFDTGNSILIKNINSIHE